jgi:hypothetical protein
MAKQIQGQRAIISFPSKHLCLTLSDQGRDAIRVVYFQATKSASGHHRMSCTGLTAALFSSRVSADM